jgi:hypothetical protein
MFQAVPVLRLGGDDQHTVQQVEGNTSAQRIRQTIKDKPTFEV